MDAWLIDAATTYRHRRSDRAIPCRTVCSCRIASPPPRRECVSVGSGPGSHARWSARSRPAWCRKPPAGHRRSCRPRWSRWRHLLSSPRWARSPLCRAWPRAVVDRDLQLDSRDIWVSWLPYQSCCRFGLPIATNEMKNCGVFFFFFWGSWGVFLGST